MKRGKKIAARLEARTKDYEKMIAAGARDSKVQQRMDAGGYTRPGSRK